MFGTSFTSFTAHSSFVLNQVRSAGSLRHTICGTRKKIELVKCFSTGLCGPKGKFHEGGKVGRSNATPTKFFSVDSFDLKSMTFKFGNDIFITFEMPGVAYSRPVDKIHISLQIRPSLIKGP